MQALSASIPADFAVSSTGLVHQFNQVTVEAEQVELIAQVKASLIPRLDFAQVKKDIAGKYPAIVEDYFKSLPNFDKVRITLNPRLPGALGTMPRKPENIIITMEETP